MKYCWPECLYPGIPHVSAAGGSYVGVRRKHKHWSRPEHLQDVVECLCDWAYIDDKPSAIDVGCGSGHLAVPLEPYITRYVGIDSNAYYLDQARLSRPDLEFRLCPAEKIDARTDEFDVAICADVLIHVEDMQLVLAELLRVASKGVILRVRTGNATKKHELVYDPDRKRLFKDVGGQLIYFNLLTESRMFDLLEPFGVSELYMRYYRPPWSAACAKTIVWFESPPKEPS